MTKRAAKVAQLLRDLKKIVNPNATSSGDEKGAVSAISNEHGAPKRPWEEISKDEPEFSHTPMVSCHLFNYETQGLDISPSLLVPTSMILLDADHELWTSEDHKSIGEI
jgi:hypothetical protein